MVDKGTDHGKPFVVDLFFTMTLRKVLDKSLAVKRKSNCATIMSSPCPVVLSNIYISRPIQRARNHSVMVKSVFDENAEARNLKFLKMKVLLR